MNKLKLMTIVGTRPEIIKMSEIIKKCDKYFEHILVHTGQNYDHTLNEVFFKDLGLRTSRLLSWGSWGKSWSNDGKYHRSFL